MSPLNESQARHVKAVFGHVDQLLSTVVRLARADLSPLSAERADVAPDEAHLLLSSVSIARARMLAALDRLGIPRPRHTVSTRWSIHTALQFGDIALSELDAAGLRGYGVVDAAAAGELEALASDLAAVLSRAVAVLHEHEAGGLAERLAALHGPAGDVLRALERLSTEHALPEVRPLIAAAAERAGAATFDVGVFGRVSAGKSSLINALAGTAVLPVGATPATAVPLRVSRGPLGAEVHLLEGGSRSITVGEIAAYGTEDRNPQNRLGVRAIEVQAPSVAAGLRFVDTPGVGSLAASGPAQAFAWLPRCDYGLVLAAAGSPVGPDDVALVSGLAHAGIACRVLLSKSDLLAPDERARSLAYVEGEMRNALGPEHVVMVQAVSILPAHAAELETLRHDLLEPLARDHARASSEALRARLHSLVRVTSAALAGRAQGSGERLISVQKARLTAREDVERETARLGGSGMSVFDEAVDALVAAWTRAEDGATAVKRTLLMVASRALASVREIVERPEIAGPADSARRRVPPLFDPELLNALPDLAPPGLGRRIAARFLARRRLEPIGPAVQDALERYAARLRAWGLAGLEAAGIEMPIEPPSPEPAQPGPLADLDARIDEEQPLQGAP